MVGDVFNEYRIDSHTLKDLRNKDRNRKNKKIKYLRILFNSKTIPEILIYIGEIFKWIQT